jgi:cyclophilin family peptidyl-prolyl cis-trans isomerase
LCAEEKDIGPTTAKPPHFNGRSFHQIIISIKKSLFIIQSGDFSSQNRTGGESIYGENFEYGNFYFKHDLEGLLNKANAGHNANGS